MLYKRKIKDVEWIISADTDKEAEKAFKEIEQGGIPE